MQINIIDNNLRYRATLKSTLPGPFAGDEVEVVSTADTPASSYGQQHWVDRNGNAYGQITLPLLGWDITKLDAISDEEADAWLNEAEAEA